MKILTFAKGVFCAIGHAIIFIMFLIFLSGDIFGDINWKLLGQPSFFEVATNVYRINLWVYIPYALIFYAVWIGIQFWILHRFRHFTLEKFVEKKFTFFYLIFCGLGYINLIAWIIGMEGNVFGFVFVLPLMLLALILGVMELRIFFRSTA